MWLLLSFWDLYWQWTRQNGYGHRIVPKSFVCTSLEPFWRSFGNIMRKIQMTRQYGPWDKHFSFQPISFKAFSIAWSKQFDPGSNKDLCCRRIMCLCSRKSHSLARSADKLCILLDSLRALNWDRLDDRADTSCYLGQ